MSEMGKQVAEEYLAHYGILGMKWGKRKARKGGTVKSSKKKTKKVDPVKKMTDYELREKINRIQMERQYKQLTKKETSAGQKFVQDVLVGAAKQTATTYVSKYMSKGVDKLIKNASKKK